MISLPRSRRRMATCCFPRSTQARSSAHPLASYLINAQADTVVVTGCSTSGCVRGSVVDAFAYNFRVLVPHDACYDRSATSHAVNLFDMASKYADVTSTENALSILCGVTLTSVTRSSSSRHSLLFRFARRNSIIVANRRKRAKSSVAQMRTHGGFSSDRDRGFPAPGRSAYASPSAAWARPACVLDFRRW